MRWASTTEIGVHLMYDLHRRTSDQYLARPLLDRPDDAVRDGLPRVQRRHRRRSLQGGDDAPKPGHGARKRSPRRLLDDDRALHIGVELAEIVECTGLIEGPAVAIARVERSRLERLTILGGSGVGDGIAVSPGHGGADRD